MANTENKPTTPTQKVLIGLICVVGLLLLLQLVAKDSNSLPTTRDECLSSGNIWSSSAERCFDAAEDANSATTAFISPGTQT